MIHRVSVTRRSAVRTAVAIAAIAFLAACTSIIPLSPAILLALDTTAASVVRGDTVEFVVTLTRTGGAADPVALAVTGLPANATASFAPASLTGATLASTLTIHADAAAAEGAATLTVTATSGTLAAEATASLTVESLTVVGRVVGLLQRPLGGVVVQSQGETSLSDVAGTFTLAGLSVPYDLAVSTAAGDGALHVFEAMTSDAPTVAPYLGVSTLPTPEREALITGTALGGGAVGVDELVIVCVEGITTVVYGCGSAGPGDTAYALSATWFDSANASVRLHAVHLEADVDGLPTAYVGYESIDANLADGVPTVHDLTLDPVGSLLVQGAIDVPASLTIESAQVFARFGPNLAMPIARVDAATSVSVLVPDVPGVSFDLVATGRNGAAASYAWTRGVATADIATLSIDDPPVQVLPAANAIGVAPGTPFTAMDAAGVRTFLWTPDPSGPSIALTTTRTQVTIPDPALGGFAFPAGLAYGWGVYGQAGVDVDRAAEGGLIDYFSFAGIGDGGGPGVRADGSASLDGSRTFVFAP